MKFLRDTYRGLYGWAFPRQCPACQRSLMRWEKQICKICEESLPVFYDINVSSELLKNRLMGRVQLHHAYSWMKFYQGGKTQKILHAIKYHKKSHLATYMGGKMGEHLKGVIDLDRNAILVPVPLHPFKMQIRGFNQSEKIADGLSSVLNIQVKNDALIRNVFHLSQTQKDKESRWEEIKNDFSAQKEEVRGRDIILVDDVCTSGATIEACAQALLKEETRSISLLTLAIAGENYK